MLRIVHPNKGNVTILCPIHNALIFVFYRRERFIAHDVGEPTSSFLLCCHRPRMSPAGVRQTANSIYSALSASRLSSTM